MIRSLFLLVLLALFLPGCACMTCGKDDSINAAREVDYRFTAAFSKGDLDGIMNLYWDSPDVVLYPPGTMVAHGHAAIRETYKQFLASAPGAKLEITESHYDIAGDVVLGQGLFTITIPSTPPTVIKGRFTDIIAKRNGQWVYLLDHPSVPLPPPPATQPARP